MTPIEILHGPINPEKARQIRWAIVYTAEEKEVRKEPKTLEELQQLLEEILARNNPGGYFKPDSTRQASWLRERELAQEIDGNDALKLVFPEKGHRAYLAVCNVLVRADVRTIPQLLARRGRALGARGIGSSGGEGTRFQTVRAIIDFFEKNPDLIP